MRRLRARPAAVVFACAFVVAAGLISGCVPGRPELRNLRQLQPGQVAVVGRVLLDPPLQENDQYIRTIGSPHEFKNTAHFIFDDELHEFEQEPGNFDFRGHLEAPLGELFYIVVPSRPHFISLGMIVMNLAGGGIQEKMYLPGQLSIDVQPGDRAVYIGTIRYRRNEFMDVERVDVLDEFEQAQRDFAQRYGSGAKLGRRPARILRQPTRN